MSSNKLLCQLLVIIILVVVYAFAATAQVPRVESVEANDNKVLVKVTGVVDANKLLVTIEDKAARVIGSPSQLFEVEVPQEIKPGPVTVDVKYDNKSIDSRSVNIPDPLRRQGGQPQLSKLEPVGGTERALITIVGKNFGKSLDRVSIWLEKKEEPEEPKKEEPVKPLSLSKPDKQNQQKLTFEIPPGQELTAEHFFSNTVQVRVKVDGQSSNALPLTVAVFNWRLKTGGLAVVVIVGLLVLLAWTTKKINFLKELLIEKKTNTYSLSKCQAFAWTLVLIASYFYLAIGKAVILGKASIPDFDPSLLALMGISYGAMLGARRLSVRVPKNDLAATPLQVSNLISEGGEISLPRLQLLGFTITAILIYLYYLSSANLFVTGLPSIPPTLLLLLGISQGGYIGGKVAGDRLAVNYVVPRRVQRGNKKVELTIIGSGLVAHTKVLFQDHPHPIDTKRKSSTLLSAILPKLPLAGWKQLVLIPPTASGIVLDNVIEVIDAKIEKIERVPKYPKRIKLTLKGFNLREIQSTIAGKPATTVSIDEANHLLTLEAEEKVKTNDKIKITSTDEQFQAETKAP